MGEEKCRNAYRILVGNPERKSSPEKKTGVNVRLTLQLTQYT